MAIDTLADKSMNVKDFVIEPTAQEPYVFNPESIITDGLWTMYQNHIREATIDEEFRELAKTAAELAVLFPERRAEMDIPDRPSDYFHIPTQRVEISDLKILYPDQVDSGFIRLHHGSQNRLVNSIREGSSLTRSIYELFMLYPNRMKDITAIAHVEPAIEQVVQRRRETRDWHSFILDATALKLLHPDKKLPISSREWQAINRTLMAMRSNEEDLPVLPYYAMRAKIIASENVEMIDAGLVLTMPKTNSFTEKPPLPEVRRF